MGYVTSFRGEIAITPPIQWGQIKNSPFLPDNAKSNDKDVMFHVEQVERETDDGTLSVRSAVGLVTTWEDGARGYNIVAHVQEAINSYPGHEFTGRLNCYGEESGDLWRLEVHGRRAVKVEPRIVWPDGSEEPRR